MPYQKLNNFHRILHRGYSFLYPNFENEAPKENEIVIDNLHKIATPVSLVVNKLTSLQIYTHDASVAATQPGEISYVMIRN
jgi:hypothetical protein